jgi:uncharacterized membrane protein YkoI
MKKALLIITALCIVTFAFAQEKGKASPPEKVKTSFAKKFPKAEKVKWEQENATEWEAEFKLAGAEYSANFNNDGTWIETEHEIKQSEIPAAVKKTLDTEFAGYKVEEYEMVETAKGTFYEFELEKGKEEIEVLIDANGKVVKKEASNEENEGEEND